MNRPSLLATGADGTGAGAAAASVLQRHGVVALTVTYGRRIALIRRCTAALEVLGIAHLVVVTNGIGAAYRAELEALQAQSRVRIELHHLPENIGAGGGFAAAIRQARASHGDAFLWLLDDDNCPRPGALDALADAMRGHDPVTTLTAFASLRGERFPLWMEAARSGDGEGVFHSRSSICSLDVRRIPAWLTKRLGRRPTSAAEATHAAVSVDVPGGPYGGFFIHARHIDTIGYPDPRYVLYFDDLEWTNRVRRMGGSVRLVPGCIVDDAEGDWAIDDTRQGKPRFFMIDLLRSSDRKRLYYSIRNNVYFKSRYWSAGWALTGANLALFVALAIGLGLALGRPRNAATMVGAAIDGVTGRLGGTL